MATHSVVLATRNPGKIREFRQVLAEVPVTVQSLEAYGDIPEPVEDGHTFAENAAKKALYYARQTGHWALADDSGLVVDALDGEPGVHSARYAADEAGEQASRDEIDQTNNRKLLDKLSGVPDPERTARFVCHLVLADPDQVLLETRGSLEGRIRHEPAGENGFGYDPLFYVPEMDCTTAQLPPEKKNAISHRGKAARHLAERLREMLNSETA